MRRRQFLTWGSEILTRFSLILQFDVEIWCVYFFLYQHSNHWEVLSQGIMGAQGHALAHSEPWNINDQLWLLMKQLLLWTLIVKGFDLKHLLTPSALPVSCYEPWPWHSSACSHTFTKHSSTDVEAQKNSSDPLYMKGYERSGLERGRRYRAQLNFSFIQ